jgi:hypothetical protein
MPLLLSANALKQKLFAIDLSSSFSIWLRPALAPCARPRYIGTSWKRGKTGGCIGAAGCGGAANMIGTCNEVILRGLGLVILMPCQRRFMWPFTVAGSGLSYLRMSFFRHIWAPFEETLLCCFQKSEDFGIAQRLVCKFDSVGLRLHLDSWVDVGIHLEVLWGTTYI